MKCRAFRVRGQGFYTVSPPPLIRHRLPKTKFTTWDPKHADPKEHGRVYTCCKPRTSKTKTGCGVSEVLRLSRVFRISGCRVYGIS